METSHEAIIDAGKLSIIILLNYLSHISQLPGISPQSIRNTNTGVYVGFSHYPLTEGTQDEVQPDWNSHKSRLALRLMSNLKSLLANRISFMFDFKGPSMAVDTACSASFAALYLAVNDMLLGNRADQK